MAEDKGLVDAYSSIYNDGKKEDQQLDEIAPLVAAVPAIAKAATVAAKVAPAAAKIGKVASTVGTVADAASSVANLTKKKQQNESLFDTPKAFKKGSMDTAGTSLDNNEFPHFSDGTTVDPSTVELHDLDGNLTHEITNVVVNDPHHEFSWKGKIAVPEEVDTALMDRLWDQVAANLTTLHEMTGTQFKVVPLEEKKEEDKEEDKDDEKKDKKKDKTKNKDEKWQDSDGDGKWYEKGEDVKAEGFNVKSPVTFSKKEEEAPKAISEETIEKYAGAISKAHKAIKK